jgi:hypothetical protein
MRRGVAAFACLFPLVCASSAAAGGLQTGIADPYTFPSAETASAFDKTAAAGATSVLISVSWRWIAPVGLVKPADFDATDSASPYYNAAAWAVIDNQVRLASARGLTPLIVIFGAPDWAEGSGTGAEGTVNPSATEFGLFAEAAATRYSGLYPDPLNPGSALPRVPWWQAWNEPNLPVFLSPQYDSAGRPYSPIMYRRLVNAFATGVHKINASNVVIAGATAPYGGAGRVRPLEFLRKMLCLSDSLKASCGAVTQFDVWSTHPYTHGGPTRHARAADDVTLADLPEMRRVLKAGVAAKHIVSYSGIPRNGVGFWVTEVGWDSRGPDPDAVPLSLHARWTAEAMYVMWSSGVTAAYWWMLRDQPLPASRWQSGFYYCGAAALTDDVAEPSCAGTPLAGDAVKANSLQAFRFPFVAYERRGRISVWGRIPPGTVGPVTVLRQTRSGWRGWKTVNVSGGIFRSSWRSSMTSGYLRARLPSRELSTPFSLKRPSSSLTYQAFGCGGTVPC